MKRLALLILAAALCACHVSCSTDPATGNKFFLGKGKGEWFAIGLAGGRAAFPAARDEYLRTSTK